MIHYFYHLDYSHIPRSTTENQPLALAETHTPATKFTKPQKPLTLSLHAKVYALGEKYNTSGLKTLAFEKFDDEGEDHGDTDDFLVAAEVAYNSTVDHDRSLRDIVVKTRGKHSCLLDKKPVQDVIKRLDLPEER
ncbi:hypothetical protein EDB80DRAFT_656007 [Ilyonectria destructans]|nr:hypothetical protein EDB80DRAFT_656007 [Ilyonectria destructans]